MRTYEALYIVTPEMEDDGIQTVDNQFQSLITESGGSIVRSEIWGKRRMAYPVKKHQEGCYILVRFESEPDLIAKLEQQFRLSEAVIRYLVVHYDEHTKRMEAEQAKRREEDLRNSAHSSGDDDDDDDRPRGSRRGMDDDDYDRPRRSRRDDDEEEE